ncbi:serine hydrolase domain-containing protein [Streptomyces sp. NPDC050418]|uniref:serine hydrolase domain-containing protein n=1 Tax=Streptomyces sp. NPDC050418 TaxID=3365612 RepID=UPI00379180B8
MTVRVVRPLRTGAIGVVVAGAVAATLLAGPAEASGSGAAGASGSGKGRGHAATQSALDAVVAAGVPGVTARVTDRHGTWKGTSGVGDLSDGTPRGARDRYRVGSVTKTFVATVLLQLQGEGRVDLDDPVEKWLPGLVRGEGYDAERITLRHLLNHTSGIYDFLDDEEFAGRFFTEEFFDHRYDTFTPQELVATGVRNKARFEPGEEWDYSNTNYVLAALVIEKATGEAYGDEIERRIIKPLGLRGTSVPGTDSRVPKPSSRAYHSFTGPGGKLRDVTELNPSAAFGSGEMISDSRDLTRFYSALLRGRLLPREQLAEMKDTVEVAPGTDYGLGLQRWRTSCGVLVWGHGGDIHGSSTTAVTTSDGRHTIAFNYNAIRTAQWKPVVEAEFCGD